MSKKDTSRLDSLSVVSDDLQVRRAQGVSHLAISVPPEVEQALDERAQMGAIGNMQACMQFKVARALGDAALAGAGEGGSMAGLGVSLGAGLGLGTAMASAIGQAF